ncbi:MAG: endonuclease/exonuclease/phosphatase family protein [Candidatus Hydrogenedentes bacterium]|nr:endonuclease/exonuclease/phosphatase family protein [Candidatus Hydrogenedentota bacterium]
MRAILAICLCAAGAYAQTPGAIKVITYNVQFLPGIAEGQNKRPDPEYRAKRIAEEVGKFDIVALQETFEERHRTAIKESVKAAWNGQLNAFESPKPAGFLTNGGCLLLTRLPILATGAVVYKNFSSPKEYGFRADGFAAKGAIWARIARGESAKDDYIDVFVTHLEARADDKRPLQYKELAEFIKAKSDPNRPLLLVGDLNTRGMAEYRNDPGSQYSVMMKAFGEARGEAGISDTWLTLMGDQLGGTTDQESDTVGRRIDYILLGNPKPPIAQLKPLAIKVNTYQDPKVTALSDHNAVEAEFEWPLPK